ncbi:MAG: YciI family protein [Actinomycetota bacterium]
MQYMLLVYDDPTQWPEFSEEEQGKVYAEYAAVSQLPNTKHSAQLQPASTARSVRVKDGERVVTDGPFADTKEILGGYYLVEADTQAEAEEIAARIPSARLGGTIEVRPVVAM